MINNVSGKSHVIYGWDENDRDWTKLKPSHFR